MRWKSISLTGDRKSHNILFSSFTITAVLLYSETSKYRTLSMAKMLTVIRKSGLVSAIQLLVSYIQKTPAT